MEKELRKEIIEIINRKGIEIRKEPDCFVGETYPVWVNGEYQGFSLNDVFNDVIYKKLGNDM